MACMRIAHIMFMKRLPQVIKNDSSLILTIIDYLSLIFVFRKWGAVQSQDICVLQEFPSSFHSFSDPHLCLLSEMWEEKHNLMNYRQQKRTVHNHLYYLTVSKQTDTISAIVM